MKLPTSVAHLPATVRVVLGSARLSVEQVARMERGTIVLLDAHVGDPVRGVVGPVDAFEGTVAATGGKFAVQVSRNLMDRVEPSKR